MRTTPLLISVGMTAIAAVAMPAPAWAAPLSMTLSSTSGPSGGGNTITGTVGAGSLAFPAGTSAVVQFQYYGTGATACRSTARDVAQIDGTATALTDGVLTVDPSDVMRISTTKIAFTVPSASYPATVDGSDSTVNTTGLALLSGQSTSKWNVCVYDSDSTISSTLIATATYTLAARPTITDVLPARSPAGGGQTITVDGTGFGTGTTATIDGVAMTNVQLAANGNSLTAVAPPHTPGTGYVLAVKTVGGTVSSSDPDNDGTPGPPIPFTYDNSITISPNTAPVGTAAYLDLLGAGFGPLTFDQTGLGSPTDPIAHVFLVQGEYDPATNRGVQECRNVVVVADTELVCELDLSADRLDPATSAPDTGHQVDAGTYTMTVVADGSTDATADEAGATILTSGATFTVAPY